MKQMVCVHLTRDSAMDQNKHADPLDVFTRTWHRLTEIRTCMTTLTHRWICPMQTAKIRTSSIRHCSHWEQQKTLILLDEVSCIPQLRSRIEMLTFVPRDNKTQKKKRNGNNNKIGNIIVCPAKQEAHIVTSYDLTRYTHRTCTRNKYIIHSELSDT